VHRKLKSVVAACVLTAAGPAVCPFPEVGHAAPRTIDNRPTAQQPPTTQAPAPATPPPTTGSNGYELTTSVQTGTATGTTTATTTTEWSCRREVVRVMSNSVTVTGSVRIMQIDAARYRFDSETGEAWVWTYEACRALDGSGRTSSRTFWDQITVVDPALGIEPAYDEAVDMIELPAPLLSPTVRGVVNLGMWLAVAEQDPIVARADITTAWAEVRATQTLTTFEFGNGDVVTCDELGTPIPRSRMDSVEEGPCGYTYRSANDGEPYTITITSTWAIEWELSDGRTGTRPDVTLSTSVEYPVIEIQTVGTRG
jgi:hypothetical protein